MDDGPQMDPQYCNTAVKIKSTHRIEMRSTN